MKIPNAGGRYNIFYHFIQTSEVFDFATGLGFRPPLFETYLIKNIPQCAMKNHVIGGFSRQVIFVKWLYRLNTYLSSST